MQRVVVTHFASLQATFCAQPTVTTSFRTSGLLVARRTRTATRTSRRACQPLLSTLRQALFQSILADQTVGARKLDRQQPPLRRALGHVDVRHADLGSHDEE